MSFSFATFGTTCESKINKRCQLILMKNKLESGSIHLPDYKRKKICLTILSKGLVKCRKEVEEKTDWLYSSLWANDCRESTLLKPYL